MITKQIFKVQVPKLIFPGFYNTNFDPDNVFKEEYEENDDYINSVIKNIINYYKKVIPNNFKIIDYQLWSPKEYNCQNDKIYLKIECTYEDILYYFFNYERESLMDFLELHNYCNNFYHKALLELLLEFWPFVDDMDEETLETQFIYGE